MTLGWGGYVKQDHKSQKHREKINGSDPIKVGRLYFSKNQIPNRK